MSAYIFAHARMHTDTQTHLLYTLLHNLYLDISSLSLFIIQTLHFPLVWFIKNETKHIYYFTLLHLYYFILFFYQSQFFTILAGSLLHLLGQVS